MSCLGYLFENTTNIDELLETLKKVVDLKEVEGEPEPIIDFGGSIDLIAIIQDLAEYPFLGIDFVIAGLKSKTMHPRNAALRTIIDWQKKNNTKELPEEVKNAVDEEYEIYKRYERN